VAGTPASRARGGFGGDDATLIVVVEPKHARGAASDRSNLPPGSKPEPDHAAPGSASGNAPFVGMSFRTLFENASVSVIRARMEVDAREGVHTHAADTIVVHLSGGEIEDTAGGKTNVNRWKPGDVEFEARGSSHSARNVGPAVDVVLVRLEP
jgi:quercetin dioxygenase-like cupin family protein